MIDVRRFGDLSTLPGRTPIRAAVDGGRRLAAMVAAWAWPPLMVTLLIWPPANWLPGRETDWRLVLLAVALAAVPLGLAALEREQARGGGPSTRLGVIWRFMLYGGVTAAAGQLVIALVMLVANLFEADDLGQAAGATETTLLIYGVGGLPLAILVGVSYALWAGLCIAFIAFRAAPPPVRDRLGVMGERPPEET